MRIPGLLPFSLWLLVAAAYAFRQPLQMAGLPVDPYFSSLFLLPVLLLVLGKISPGEMGFKIGKPLYGLFFVFLLPGVLFLRYYFTGLRFSLAENYFPLILIGSVAEEFFFRGYLQSRFEKELNKPLSFFLTNLLFMLVHVIKGYSLLPALMTGVVGLYFSFTRDKNGGDSLLYSAGSHSLYNLVVTSIQKF